MGEDGGGARSQRVDLYLHLLTQRLPEAAVGLLLDLLRMYTTSPQNPDYAKDLMAMLDDRDGAIVADWVQLFRVQGGDSEQLRTKARKVVYAFMASLQDLDPSP